MTPQEKTILIGAAWLMIGWLISAIGFGIIVAAMYEEMTRGRV